MKTVILQDGTNSFLKFERKPRDVTIQTAGQVLSGKIQSRQILPDEKYKHEYGEK